MASLYQRSVTAALSARRRRGSEARGAVGAGEPLEPEDRCRLDLGVQADLLDRSLPDMAGAGDQLVDLERLVGADAGGGQRQLEAALVDGEGIEVHGDHDRR